MKNVHDGGRFKRMVNPIYQVFSLPYKDWFSDQVHYLVINPDDYKEKRLFGKLYPGYPKYHESKEKRFKNLKYMRTGN